MPVSVLKSFCQRGKGMEKSAKCRVHPNTKGFQKTVMLIQDDSTFQEEGVIIFRRPEWFKAVCSAIYFICTFSFMFLYQIYPVICYKSYSVIFINSPLGYMCTNLILLKYNFPTTNVKCNIISFLHSVETKLPIFKTHLYPCGTFGGQGIAYNVLKEQLLVHICFDIVHSMNMTLYRLI